MNSKGRWIEWGEAVEIEHEMLNSDESVQPLPANSWSRFLQAHLQTLQNCSKAQREISSVSRAAIVLDCLKGGAHGFAEIAKTHSGHQSLAVYACEAK
jgi:hypothetical protein